MSTFAFKAVDGRGSAAQGEVEGQDADSVIKQLRSRGLIVLKFDEVKPTDVKDIFGRFRRAKARDITVMTRQLSTMVGAGMPLLRCLYSLEEQTTNVDLRSAIVDVRKRVESGDTLADSMARHPRIFNELYIAMVRAGEKGGLLEDSLDRIANQLEANDSLRRQIKSATVYPTLIASFAVIILIAMVAFLIPVFEKVLKDVDPTAKDLPFITQISIGASHMVTDRWYLLILGFVGVIFGFKRWKGSDKGQRQWDRLKLKMPFRIGKLVHKIALARFSRTLAGLVSGGVPVIESLEITGRTAGNTIIQEAMVDVVNSVRTGGKISHPMLKAPKAFPPLVPHMIEIGEDSGALEVMLVKIAEFYEDEVDAGVKSLSSTLEPLMLVVVGTVVGFIVISMYLPLFQIYDKVK